MTTEKLIEPRPYLVLGKTYAVYDEADMYTVWTVAADGETVDQQVGLIEPDQDVSYRKFYVIPTYGLAADAPAEELPHSYRSLKQALAALVQAAGLCGG